MLNIYNSLIMIVKAEIFEIAMDNYQGGSGKPIVRCLMVDLPNDTPLDEIINKVTEKVRDVELNTVWGSGTQCGGTINVLKVEILPLV
jgi:hypothetical protein